MAIWEEKKMKKKTVPTRHAILMAGIQEEKRQAQLKEAYGITEEVTVVEKKHAPPSCSGYWSMPYL